MSHSKPFCLFSFFSGVFTQKTVMFWGIRTKIVRVEGERADHSGLMPAECFSPNCFNQKLCNEPANDWSERSRQPGKSPCTPSGWQSCYRCRRILRRRRFGKFSFRRQSKILVDARGKVRSRPPSKMFDFELKELPLQVLMLCPVEVIDF